MSHPSGTGPRYRVRMPALHTRMVARDSSEAHRSATPLELFFDLTFVVAIAQLVQATVHAFAEDHAAEALPSFLMVFFAIWWAWMNFTWLASSWDTDDVLWRVTAFVQMAGVLVIAAGISLAFDEGDFTAVVIGYLVMRIGLVAQLLRAWREDPNTGTLALRWAVAISVVQVAWLFRNLVPEPFLILSFVVLALAELAVPWWAERGRAMLPWHPHHIAERYGLFTIILLGESVLAATIGVQAALSAAGVSTPLVVVAAAGLALIFALWWLYFKEPAGEGLENRRERAYWWGYGHYLVFAALAAVGAGLELAIESVYHDIAASDLLVAYTLAVPLAVFLLLLWVLHAPLVDDVVIPPFASIAAVAVVLALPLGIGVLGVVGVVVGCALAVIGLLAVTLVRAARSHPAAIH